MPFPSVQGTQAAVRSMIDAEHAAGLEPELLTYAHGAYESQFPWQIHRIADVVRDRSLRSGPSWRKLVQDAQLIAKLSQVAAEKDVVIAHHVEAALAVRAARTRPNVFVAHTALGPELPTYLPGPLRRIAAKSGDVLDAALARGADACAAVSPMLADQLAQVAGVEVSPLPIPWGIARPIDKEERAQARARFELSPLESVLLYAGNLDEYQGLDVLVQAFTYVRQKMAKTRLIVASESDHGPIERKLWTAGVVDSTIFAPLTDEPDRRAVHAAADAVWIVRGAPGGLPIKLLDALSRGVPAIVTRRACAGYSLSHAATIAPDDDAEGLAAAALLVLQGRETAIEIANRGVEHLRSAHSPEQYLRAMAKVRAQAMRSTS
jgi:glycosyltransferase involved in cell wall biosynthesis